MKTIYKKLLFLFLLLPFGVLAQSTLSGVVVDEKSNQPLPGVNVTVQGAAQGTSTDFDGKFQLAGLKSGDVIVFSFIGYENKNLKYSGQKTVSISFGESANQLQEVVVQVGYGNVKKKDATGSVALLTTKEFNKGANVTAENLLTGRVAGVTVNTSGAPGSGSEIRIRGGSSLFAKNDPLIVIDGLPIETNSDKNYGSTSILASINPSTIESISILKDASASAIYGSRASNGVIIITTKKGGKTLAVDYNFQYGSGKLVKTVDVFGADAFRAIVAAELPARAGELGNANTNWQEEIYRRTDYVDNNLSVRGNLFNTIPTRLTIGNTYQEGLRLTNRFNRNTVSLAMNPSFFQDHLKFKLNANYANEKNRFADGVEGDAMRFDPTQPVRDNGPAYDGFFEYHGLANVDGDYPLISQTPRNPVAKLLQTYDTGENNRFYGNFELDYKLHFVPELRGVVNVAFDEANGDRSKVASVNTASSGSLNNIPYGTNEYSTSLRKNKLLDAYFVYSKKFGNTSFDLTGGYSYQKFQSRRYESGNLNDPNLPTGPTGYPQTTIDTDVVLVGFFARSNISFNDKYLLTASYRRDGSSRFSKENRFGNFPSIAFAWKLKEDFFKNSSLISDMKLRLGWGITGQQDIPATNDYLQKVVLGSGSSQYIFGPSATPIAITSRLSPNLKWEETTTYNVGLDYGILKNRITGAIDFFYKDSKDLLVDAAVSDGSNFSNRAWQNVGSFTTKGVELTINTDVVKNNNVTWNLNFNATKYERRISSLIYNTDIVLGDNLAGTGTQGQILSEGFSPYSFYVYKQLYDTAGAPVEGAFADLNGDGIINTKDKYIYKNPDPDVTFGLASNFNYKNLDFSFTLRASVGNRILNAVTAKNAYYDFLSTGGALGNIPTAVLDTNFSTSTDKNVLSDMNVENASYLKMDNISLGYTFPKWLDGKASLRLFTGIQNVFTVTKYSGLDPEITNNGVDNTIYPRQRSFLFGANVKF
jgi:TonB-linked SusC/RagA family outer membrane protein